MLNPNGGNVGIGITSAPTSKLEVNGNVKANSFNDIIVKAKGDNVIIGQGNVLGSLTSTTGNNIAVGQYTLNYLESGSQNLGMGYSTMYSTRGSNNVGLGHEAMYDNNTGNNNTAVGHSAGRANTGSNILGLLSFLVFDFLLVLNSEIFSCSILVVDRLDSIEAKASPVLRLLWSAPDIDPLGFSGVYVLDETKAATLTRD
jgi:hypothetical protein